MRIDDKIDSWKICKSCKLLIFFAGFCDLLTNVFYDSTLLKYHAVIARVGGYEYCFTSVSPI